MYTNESLTLAGYYLLFGTLGYVISGFATRVCCAFAGVNPVRTEKIAEYVTLIGIGASVWTVSALSLKSTNK